MWINFFSSSLIMWKWLGTVRSLSWSSLMRLSALWAPNTLPLPSCDRDWCPVSSSYQFYSPASPTLHQLKAGCLLPRQLLGESPEQLSQINKSNKGSSWQWMGLCSRSLFANLSFGTWEIFLRRSNVMRCGKDSRLAHTTDWTRKDLKSRALRIQLQGQYICSIFSSIYRHLLRLGKTPGDVGISIYLSFVRWLISGSWHQ